MDKGKDREMEELKDIKELYGAWIRFPKGEEEIVFVYSAMEIKARYELMLEMRLSIKKREIYIK